MRNNRKTIYLYGFNNEQIKIIKKKNPKGIFIIERKISEKINNCDAIVAPTRLKIEQVLSRVNFTNNTKLKWIHLPGSGVEKYTKYFRFNKIKFTNGKGIQNHQISDHAIGLLLSITRKINLNIKYDQKVKFDRRPIELNKKTAVIIGYGGNGKLIAKKLMAFDMHIRVVNYTKKKTPKKIKFFRAQDIIKAVKNTDVLFISTPLTKNTYGIINAKVIKEMNKGSIIINVSRPGCLNLKDLIIFLKNKHLGGSGLDVVEGEPLGKNHPLLKFDNVVVTPHTGGISDNFYFRNLELILENIKRFILSNSLCNMVDTKRGY